MYRNRIARLKNNFQAQGIEGVNVDLIYDGPDETHKFNRMVLRPEQVDALARLIGFRPAMDIRNESIEGGNIRNLYYILEINPNFNPFTISHEQLVSDLKTLGVLVPETDFNMYVKAWDMTLGQALLFGLDSNLPHVYNEIERFQGLQLGYPQVIASFHGGKELFLETFVETDIFLEDKRMTRSISLAA